MRRYKFLKKEDIYAAFDKLTDAFLAAKNGNEVEEIINGLLTRDEKLKIGRRILVAEYLKAGINFENIVKTLKVGKNTIISVMKNLDEYPEFFTLINSRSQKVDKEYLRKKYTVSGGSKLVYKKKQYTGFKRKDIER